jgi:hypothetical protein
MVVVCNKDHMVGIYRAEGRKSVANNSEECY